MQKFLDNFGFAYFVDKLKAYVDKKSKIETGETIVDKGGVIDVATPVKGVISQADFDALPLDEQNHGVYVIPGTGGAPGGEVYSDEEVVIGTWIDGKPLYRKVIETTTANNTKTNFTDAKPVVKHGGIETLTRFTAILQRQASSDETKYALPIHYDSETSAYMWIAGNLIYSRIGTSGTEYLNQPATVVIEYTKTTD